MSIVDLQRDDQIATLTLSRGKVNAINGALINQLRATLNICRGDQDISAIVLTGAGKFFSFGFDVPELLSLSKRQFTSFVVSFTHLYTQIFEYPKPIIAALNGHAIAGGCMLALACDYRVMVNGKARIALNEIGFGASVPAGSVEMLRFWVGSATATAILVSGAFLPAERAESLGLVDEIVAPEKLIDTARRVATGFGSKHQPAFVSMKGLLRANTVADMKRRERDQIKKFVDIWYSKETRANLKNIKIR